MSLGLIPLTPASAQRFISEWHRHHGPVPAAYAQICIGAVDGERLCGVSISGRPTNRNSDDGQTIEVLRLATDGTRNAPSLLLGASARAAKAMGAWRIITYTLENESGESLRGAGWVREKDGIKSNWSGDFPSSQGRKVVPRAHFDEPKVRWVCYFADAPRSVLLPLVSAVDDAQGVLFAGDSPTGNAS